MLACALTPMQTMSRVVLNFALLNRNLYSINTAVSAAVEIKKNDLCNVFLPQRMITTFVFLVYMTQACW